MSPKKLILASMLSTFAFVSQAQTLKPTIDLSTAKAIANGCEEAARHAGWKMNIAIMDAGGNLSYFAHMDDAYGISVRVAQLKAQTSAQTPFSTRNFRDAAKGAPGLEFIPGSTIVAGGLPIMTASGKQLGGLGVSGGTEDQDEACAKAGLEAAKALLK